MIVIFCDNSVLNLYWICTTDGAKDLVLKKCSISGDHQFHIFHFADQTLLANLPTTYPSNHQNFYSPEARTNPSSPLYSDFHSAHSFICISLKSSRTVFKSIRCVYFFWVPDHTLMSVSLIQRLQMRNPTLNFAHLRSMNFTCNGPFLSFLIARAPFCLFYGEVCIRIGGLEVGPARLIQYI